MSQESIRVAIVEDDARYRASLETLLRYTPGFELVDTFGNPSAMLDHLSARQHEPFPWGLMLMDLEMPGMSGIEGTRRVKEVNPEVPVIVVTSFEEPATILQAICAGADGYVLKKATAKELIGHMKTVTSGGSSLTGEVARSVLDVVRRYGAQEEEKKAKPQKLGLTPREQDVLRSLSHGHAYQEVADDLGVSIHTVRDHIRNIYRKLQVHSATEAVSRAVREGLI